MGRAKHSTVGSTDTLIIKTRLTDGSIWIHGLEQKARTHAEIQNEISTLTDPIKGEPEEILAVWFLTTSASGFLVAPYDLKDDFDLRWPDEIARDAAHDNAVAERITPFNPQAAQGTYNHAQQGLA